jgi:hypothetical protein
VSMAQRLGSTFISIPIIIYVSRGDYILHVCQMPTTNCTPESGAASHYGYSWDVLVFLVEATS